MSRRQRLPTFIVLLLLMVSLPKLLIPICIVTAGGTGQWPLRGVRLRHPSGNLQPLRRPPATKSNGINRQTQQHLLLVLPIGGLALLLPVHFRASFSRKPPPPPEPQSPQPQQWLLPRLFNGTSASLQSRLNTSLLLLARWRSVSARDWAVWMLHGCTMPITAPLRWWTNGSAGFNSGVGAVKVWLLRSLPRLSVFRNLWRLGRRGTSWGRGIGSTSALTTDQEALLAQLKEDLFGGEAEAAAEKAKKGAELARSQSSAVSEAEPRTSRRRMSRWNQKQPGRDSLSSSRGKTRQRLIEGRGKACGLPLTDVLLLRYLRTAGWRMAYPDGNTVAESVVNTIVWREHKQLSRVATQRSEREARFAGILTAAAPAGPLMWVAKVTDQSGRAAVVIRPALIDSIASSKQLLARVPDLILYTLERAELLQTKTQTNAAGVVVLVDCANCTLNAMKSFVLSVRFPISDIATPRLTFSCHH